MAGLERGRSIDRSLPLWMGSSGLTRRGCCPKHAVGGIHVPIGIHAAREPTFIRNKNL